MSYVFVGAACFWMGVGAAYLSTHSELRSALFSKLHSTADDVFAKIKVKMGK